MSHITNIKLKISLTKETPKELILWLNKCIEENYDVRYENNSFFETERWTKMFATYGYEWYDKPYIKEVKNKYELLLFTDINNENDELNTFINWIAPYVHGRKKKVYLGCYRRDGEYVDTNVYLYR